MFAGMSSKPIPSSSGGMDMFSNMSMKSTGPTNPYAKAQGEF